MNTVSQHQVTRLHYSRSKRRLEIAFADEAEYQLTAEFLRVFRPLLRCGATGRGKRRCKPASPRSASRGSNQWGTTRCRLALMTDTIQACIAGSICVTLPSNRTGIGKATSSNWQLQGNHGTLRFRSCILTPDTDTSRL